MPSNFYTPVALKYVPEPEGNLAMLDADGQIEKLAILPDETITCGIDELQATIDRLPKYLNRNVTINVDPGIHAGDITIEKFSGPGRLTINCSLVTGNFNWQVNRVVIDDCYIPYCLIQGLSATATTGYAWFVNHFNGFLYLYRCNAAGDGTPGSGGLNSDTANYGFFFVRTQFGLISACTVSDKYRAFALQGSRLRVAGNLGQDNNTVFRSELGGIAHLTAANTITGTTLYNVADASLIITQTGSIITLAPATTTISNIAPEDLQAEINKLPKYLNRSWTINVIAGTWAGTLTIENFTGPGVLQILGPAATGDFTRQVTRVIIQNCNVGYVYIRGISANATTGNAWYISQVTSPMLYIDRCNAAGDGTPGSGGNPATTTNMGFYSFRSTGVYCENCTVSDKYRAFYARSGRMLSGAEHGTNNTVVYNSEINGQLQIQARGTIEGTTLYRSIDGSFIITELGDFVTSTGISYPRRSSDLGIVLTTDQILAHGQSLATFIERRIQDQIYVTTNTFYTLRIHVRQGVATNATFRLHGMTIRAHIQVFIDPDVTLSGIVIYGNTSMSLVVNNQGTINGNVTIMYNTATVDSIGYNQNYAATVLPVYPTTHPLSGQAIPIQHSRVTGGIMIMQNDAKNHIYCLVGQHCQVGQPDVHDVVAAPSVGSTTNGAINLLYNRAIGSCYVIAYATYMENDPVIPGPVVVGRIYNYYNESNSSVYNTVQSGWREGTQPTVESAYVYYNKSATAAYQQIGNGRPATTFAGNWTAVAEADSSTANRNTVVLTANMLAGREATVVGMGFTFINAATTSSSGNYSGTFKRVTAYDPATRTVTLSANFNLPRPQATCYFFPYAAQTDIYYGTSHKIEAMLQDAYNTGQPYGLRQTDGNNLGRAYRITAIDTTLKTITISPGLNANGVYNGSFTPCGTFSPICIMDYEATFTKTAANTLRGTGDLMLYPYSDRMLLGRRITGVGITGSAEVTAVQWVSNNLLQLTLDTDPNVPIDASVHTYNIRRAPGHGHYAVCYNHCGSDAYINVGYPGMAENGGIKLRSAIAAYNHCGAACFINTNDFAGDVVNANGAVRIGYIDVYYNVTGSSAYMYGRANNNAGGDGYLGRIRVYSNNSGYESAIGLASHTTVSREVLLYNNYAGYRAWVDCELPGGVTISATTAPQIRGYLNVYRITAPHVWVNRVSVKPALIAENGLATSDRCLLLQDINGRAYIASASMWLDISNNTAVNSSCVYANVNTNFEYGFAVSSTYGGTQCYALRVVDNANARIAARPAIGPKILLTGYTQAHVGSTIATDNIYKADHTGGRDDNVAVLKSGHWLEDTEITGA